jgi:YidC/Oxa1 family membrane protein insertase
VTELWNAAIIGPLTGGIVYLYGLLGSYGLAIIVLTLAIKLITFPLNRAQIRSSKAMRDIQPLIDEAKRRYGKDKEKFAQEQMRIYRENGVNPVAGCLPMLVQMPIWFGLYHVLLNLAQTSEEFNRGFLWLPSLATPDPLYILVILTVVTQFVVQKMMAMPSNDPQQQTMNKVMLFMPLSFGFIAMNVPSGLALYWVTTNIFTFFQQLLTTGWGGLLPNNAPTPAVVAVGSGESNSSNGTVGNTLASRAVKASKHKKRSKGKASKTKPKANG